VCGTAETETGESDSRGKKVTIIRRESHGKLKVKAQAMSMAKERKQFAGKKIPGSWEEGDRETCDGRKRGNF